MKMASVSATVLSSNTTRFPPSSSPKQSPKFSIPTIDLTPYLNPSSTSSSSTASSPSLDSPETQAIIAQIQEACIGSGFFQLIGHGVSRELQSAVFKGAEAFFGLQREVKERVDMKRGGGRGYEVLAAQTLTSDNHTSKTTKTTNHLPDQKEGFYIGLSVPSTHPLVQQKKTFLIGPNQYPSPSILPHEVFRDVMEKYHSEMLRLSGIVLQLIEAGMTGLEVNGNEARGIGEELALNADEKSMFDGIYYPPGSKGGKEFPEGEDVIATLRLLHYPPLLSTTPPLRPSSSDSSENIKQVVPLGAGPHTDFGFITLLLQDSIGGLEVLDPSCTTTSPSSLPEQSPGQSTESAAKEKIWHPVPPNPDAYVVNIGDMLQMFSKGRYRSSVHRVVLKPPTTSASGDTSQSNGEDIGKSEEVMRKGVGKSRYSIPFFFDGRAGFVLRTEEKSGDGVGEGLKGELTVEGYMRERFRKTYGK